MAAGVWYCTRESVKAALDEAETARSNAQIDDAIEQGARDIDGLCHRDDEGMAPLLATRTFDYPSGTGRPPAYRVWFDGHRLISATAVTSDNATITITPSQYKLRPSNRPPYRWIEVDLSTVASFGSGGTWQDAIAITGLWGEANTTRSIGSLAGSLAASATAQASLTWTTARFGVGDVLLIDSERMVITERGFVDSTQNLGAALDADSADTQVSVSDGTGFAVEEIISVGGERMRIVDITGNTLTVIRAWDGSQLDAHLINADVYALTGVELQRAVLGTTLAAHSASAVVYRWIPPGLLATLNRAYAINVLVQERAAWARAISVASDTAVEASGRGIAKLEKDVQRLYGRNTMLRSIT